jgi:predicted O-methyltransferase YrrM
MRMLQWQAEVDAFTEFIRQHGVNNVLEIGTGPGGFIDHLGNVTTGALVSVDLPMSKGDPTTMTREHCIARNRELQTRHPRYHGILGDSHSQDVQDKVARSLELRVDLLFLDGDDSFDGKLQDFRDYSRFVRDGGWIATHDIVSHGLCGVPLFWGTVKGERYEFIEPGHPWGGIGVVRWSR